MFKGCYSNCIIAQVKIIKENHTALLTLMKYHLITKNTHPKPVKITRRELHFISLLYPSQNH